MQTRTFGPNDTRVPILGLGCSRIGSFNNPTPQAEIRRTLERALDLGVNLLDTADIYGQGDSERTIGRLLRGRRDAAFVVSKVGKTFSTPMRLIRPFKPVLRPLAIRVAAVRRGITGQRDASMAHDFSPAYVTQSLHRSLTRLQFEALDALLLHSPPAKALTDPALGEALQALHTAGKIRHFGVSCDDAECLRAAVAIPGLSLLELPLDVIEGAEAAELAPIIAERRIGVIAREVIRLQPRSSATDAVRHAVTHRGVTCVVVGTSSASHLTTLARALDLIDDPE